MIDTKMFARHEIFIIDDSFPGDRSCPNDDNIINSFFYPLIILLMIYCIFNNQEIVRRNYNDNVYL